MLNIFHLATLLYNSHCAERPPPPLRLSRQMTEVAARRQRGSVQIVSTDLRDVRMFLRVCVCVG